MELLLVIISKAEGKFVKMLLLFGTMVLAEIYIVKLRIF